MGVNSSSQRLRTALSLKGRSSEKRKILVLGCMGAGKTTLCRMIAKAANAHLPPARLYKHTIENNLLELFKVKYKCCYHVVFSDRRNNDDLEILSVFRHKEDLHSTSIAAIKRLLKSNLYIEIMKEKGRILELPYNAPYYIQNAERILDPKFEPTDADMCAVYSQTVGANYKSIDMGVVTYEVLELPGHHIFRRIWADFFDNTTVIIFVIDLSDLCRQAFYNKGHLQDKVRTILLSVVMNRLLNKTAFILLFNKRDLLEEIGMTFNFQQLGAGIKTWEGAEKWYMDQCMSAIPPTNPVYSHSMSLTKKPDMNTTLFESLEKIFQFNTRSIDLE
ncbi:hypothetical protein PFISCL1PPCAC_15156 [Pristionchus fissidentatus]|uniref:ADP ribosylation factor n=1 Tax=Pristionchus fissidentatus TaxID=1538716 RepID=A0AAV5W1R4_9BILA|nr:hypothetical protein PFISCL1PPCAC_15156 [Pristionchus fissidentatus]